MSTRADTDEQAPGRRPAEGPGTPPAGAEAPAAATAPSSRRSALWKLLAGAAALAALYLLAREAGSAVPRFAAWVDGLGFWGPAVFVGGYAVAVAALVPGSILTLAGGALFGLAEGTLYVFLAATLGSTLAFLVGRYLARGLVEERLAGSPRFRAMDRAVGDQGLRITFLMRLSPVFPFSLLNYALGLTRVRLRDYVLASFGMLPGTFLYVYYGTLARDVAALAADGAPVERGVGYYAVLLLGLAATVAVTAVVTRVARRALAEATDGEALES